MTTFLDGPVAGTVLQLQRAPMFVRVVIDGLDVDALDQLEDEPLAREVVVVYQRVGTPGTCHVDGRDVKTGKRYGQTYTIAEYKVVSEQPEDFKVRSTPAWRAWCEQMQIGAGK